MSDVSLGKNPDHPSGEVIWGAFDLSSRRVAAASSSGVAVSTIKLVETVLSKFEADPSRTGGSPSEVTRLIGHARALGVDMGLFERRLQKLVKPYAASWCEWELSRLENRLEEEPPHTLEYAAKLIKKAREVGVDTSGYEERLRKVAPIYAALACERALSCVERAALSPEDAVLFIEEARRLGVDTSWYEERLERATPMYFAWICERAIADREKYAPENWVELLYPSSKIQELIETARETGVDTSGFEARLAKLASA